MATKLLLVAVLLCSIVIPVGGFLLSKRKEGGFKAALFCNLFFFFGTVLVADILLFSGNVQAAGDAASAAASNAEGWKYMAAALSTGISCIGAGIAVASAASAALGALSEDSSIMGKALIFVALAESIALYGLLISFSILG
ncbi:ATP synthase subunit C [Lachnospiraceae bacterium 29-84]